MKTLTFEQNEREEWLYFRRGKITGSRLKDVVSSGGATKEMICAILDKFKVPYDKKFKKEELESLCTPEIRGALQAQLPKKIGFYELIAERLGLPPENKENQMERGVRLESDAIDRFIAETGVQVDKRLYLWQRVDNDSIALSPDGVISETEAVEAKCLSSPRHIEAFLTKQIPDEYEYQMLQYFVVNDKLETLHFVFFDPRFAMFTDPDSRKTTLDYFEIVVRREEVKARVDELLEYEKTVIAEVNTIVNDLTF